jgi:hypothetical protein
METTDLDARIHALATEVVELRGEVARLRAERRRRGAPLLVACFLIGLSLVGGGAFTRAVTAQGTKGNPVPNSVMAAFVVVDHDNRPMMEVNDEPGKKGLAVYGPPEAARNEVFLGFAKTSAGVGPLILMSVSHDSVVERIDSDGYRYYASGNKALAMMGSRGGNKGIVTVYNPVGKAIAFLTESDTSAGGGNVSAADPGGGVFSAGFSGDGGNACVNRGKNGGSASVSACR